MPEKFEDKRIEKAEVRLIAHYDPEAHDRASIRKWLEDKSSPFVLIIVTNVKKYK